MKRFTLLAVLGVVLFAFAPAAGAAPATQTDYTCNGADGIYLYEHTEYRGRCVRYIADVPDVSAQAFNNITSSVRVVGSWTVSLYINQNYSGAVTILTRDDPDLTNNEVGNNTVSSARIRTGTSGTANICDGSEGVYFYDRPQYLGTCVRYTSDVADMSAQAFNNTASSLRIVGNWTATVFIDQNYRGVSTVFTRDDPDFADNTIGNGRASSAQIRRGADAGGACDNTEGVYLYEHSRYQGRCVRLTADTPDLSTVNFNNTASSIRIIGRWSARLYIDQNYAGDSSVFDQDDNDLGDNVIGDNRASAVRISRGAQPPPTSGPSTNCDGSEGVYLYELPQFGGICARFNADSADLRNQNFNDIASSIRIVGNYSVELARDLDFTGTISTFIGDDPDLGNDAIGDNQTTSIRIVRGGIPPEGFRCDGGQGVYVYEHPRYQGRCVKFTADAGDLRAFAFDDNISSLRTVGRWSVTLYRDLNATGSSSTFTGDDENVANDAIGDNQATSLRVRRR